jgi:hypothetical protein
LSLRDLDGFREQVLQEVSLQEQLFGTSERSAFLDLMVRVGAERDYRFTSGEVDTAIQTGRRQPALAQPAGVSAGLTQMSGWVPIRLDWHNSSPFANWAYFGRTRFTEPFFEDSVRRAFRHPFNSLFLRQTPLETMGALQASEPGLSPSGFIFHMSRCGSTLISQMLAALPQTVVISEAEPLDTVLRGGGVASRITEEHRLAGFQWMVGALGHPRVGGETHYFIKFDSWHTAYLSLIEQAFPTVPKLFVYRDPVEVLVSHLNRPGSQMVRGNLDPDLLGLDAPAVEGMTGEEYYARVLGFTCGAAVRHQGLRLVNYQELPEAVESSLLDFFKLPCTRAERERMREVARFSAKDPWWEFVPDGASKQTAASAAVRELAERWVGPIYRQLESHRSHRGAPANPPER